MYHSVVREDHSVATGYGREVTRDRSVATVTRELGRTSVVGGSLRLPCSRRSCGATTLRGLLCSSAGPGSARPRSGKPGRACQGAGLCVLPARPTDAEAQFSFGALVDLR